METDVLVVWTVGTILAVVPWRAMVGPAGEITQVSGIVILILGMFLL